MHITFALLKSVAVTVSETVTVASFGCNFLPKSTLLDGYPRVKKAYETGINFVTVLAFNFRMCMPSLGLHIPFLGFEKPVKAEPELPYPLAPDPPPSLPLH